MPELKCYAYASFYVKRRPELLFLIRKETPFPGYGGHALDYPYRGLNAQNERYSFGASLLSH